MGFVVEQIVGADNPEYAYTRAFDFNTANPIMRGPTWKSGQPQIERIYHTLSTDLGTYAPDPLFGFKYKVLDHMTSQSNSSIKIEVERALRYMVEDNSIKRLAVVCEVARSHQFGGAFCKTFISFYDPRSRRNVQVKGRFSNG